MQKIFMSIMAVVLCVSMVPASVFADDGDSSSDKASVSILHNCANAEDNNGASIMCILKLVIDIMTVGVGILGVIGISISGVQYLTAGGSEEKTRKAKRRIFEIAIGLVAYVMVYALLSWLLPTFGS